MKKTLLRTVAALLSGLDEVPLVWDEDDLDWDMYRRCVEECKRRGVHSPKDLPPRIISEAEYKEKCRPERRSRHQHH